jgi:hypothetical protein
VVFPSLEVLQINAAAAQLHFRAKSSGGRPVMKKTCMLGLLLTLCICLVATSANAQVGKGLKGPHYNLNIIGVPHDKDADMIGSHGHSIFVPLNTEGRVDGKVKIYFVAGDEFQVYDRNATDNNGATVYVPHGDPGTVCYRVFAVGLGRPGGRAHVEGNVIFDESEHLVFLELDQVDFTVNRKRGKPKRQEISNIFRVSGCIDVNNTGVCDPGDEFFNNEWVFNIEDLLEYWWDYYNSNLKLMQIRFYDCYGHMAEESIPAPERETTWGSIKSLYR